jgi:hypothetical protein
MHTWLYFFLGIRDGLTCYTSFFSLNAVSILKNMFRVKRDILSEKSITISKQIKKVTSITIDPIIILTNGDSF